MFRSTFTAVAKKQLTSYTNATRHASLLPTTYIRPNFTVSKNINSFKKYSAPAFTATTSAASLFTTAKPTNDNDIEHQLSPRGTYATHVLHHGDAESTHTQWKPEYGTLDQFKDIPDLSGEKFDFSKLDGKVVLVTNSACMCGYTKKAFEHMVAWKNKFSNRPFEIVAFPSNSFNQEKSTSEEIKDYLSVFNVNFPLMSTSDVNGTNQNPVFKWLKQSFPGPITWNFGAYWLIDPTGKPIARFEKASWDTIESAIENAVKDAEKANKSKKD